MSGPCTTIRQYRDRDQDLQDEADEELETARQEADSFSFCLRHKFTNPRLESAMSTLLRLSTPRLEKAIERSGLKDGQLSIRDLRRTLERRGMSDREMHSLFFKLINVLEPPQCYMTHCKHFGGAGASMNCADGRIPGRCSILKEYKARKVEREKKALEAEAKTGVSSDSQQAK